MLKVLAERWGFRTPHLILLGRAHKLFNTSAGFTGQGRHPNRTDYGPKTVLHVVAGGLLFPRMGSELTCWAFTVWPVLGQGYMHLVLKRTL